MIIPRCIACHQPVDIGEVRTAFVCKKCAAGDTPTTRWIPVTESLPEAEEGWAVTDCFVVITHFTFGKPTRRFTTFATYFCEDKYFGVPCVTRMGENANDIYPIYQPEFWDGKVTGDTITHYYIPTLPVLPALPDEVK